MHRAVFTIENDHTASLSSVLRCRSHYFALLHTISQNRRSDAVDDVDQLLVSSLDAGFSISSDINDSGPSAPLIIWPFCCCRCSTLQPPTGTGDLWLETPSWKLAWSCMHANSVGL